MIVGGSASQNNREDEDKSGCIYILVGSINIKVAYLLFVNTIHNYKLSLGHGGGGGDDTMKWFPTVEEDDYTRTFCLWDIQRDFRSETVDSSIGFQLHFRSWCVRDKRKRNKLFYN